MNRIIETNASELLGSVYARARTTASQTQPPVEVSMKTESGCMVGELFDVDPIEKDGGISLKIIDPSSIEAQIETLRTNASPSLKRVLTAFKGKLVEAKIKAKDSHVEKIAKPERLIISGSTSSTSPILGRPLSNYGINELVTAKNHMVDFLLDQTSSTRIAYDGEQGDEFITNFSVLGGHISVTTRSVFKIVDGKITHRYRHTINVASNNHHTHVINVFLILRNCFKNQNSVSVIRHNKTLNGALRHFEKFALLAIDAIEEELVTRTNQLSSAGLTLIITREPVDYTPTEDVDALEVAQAFEGIAEPIVETNNV